MASIKYLVMAFFEDNPHKQHIYNTTIPPVVGDILNYNRKDYVVLKRRLYDGQGTCTEHITIFVTESKTDFES